MDSFSTPIPAPIFLYGPPGSGKSAVGRALAQDLGLSFYDLDNEIQSRSGATIPEIFSLEGEPGFRERERAELRRILALGDGVVALGGGALTDPASRALAESSGTVLCLSAPFEILLARLQADPNPRPLLAGDAHARLEDLLARRADHYASFPLRFESGERTPERVAWEAQVRLGIFRVSGMGQAYDVRVVPGGLDRLGQIMAQRGLRGPVALVSDENVGKWYAPQVLNSLESFGFSPQVTLIPPGEANKTLETAARLWEAFLSAGVERGSTVVALGGGVVGDLTGFAAATFLRGVPWVAVPTSLLAMADASLGGKTGADLPQGKNLVGAFHAPRLVLADPETLVTLPREELRSGLAEVVKAGVIADPRLFDLCKNLGDFQDLSKLSEVVRRSMAVKIRFIQDDPFEKGFRAALNLGHTLGHGVELASGFRLRHGEAVAIGMVGEARLAARLGLAEIGLAEEIAAVLSGLGLPTEIPTWLDRQAVLDSMRVDKKRSRGIVRFALPIKIGEVRVGVEAGDWTGLFADG